MNYRSRLSRRMSLGGLAAVAAAAVVLGACGSAAPASAPPQQGVTRAFHSLGSRSGIDVRISLGVTGEELRQMATTGGSGRLSPTAARDIASTSIVVDLNSGNGKPLNSIQARTNRHETFGLAVQVGTSAPVQLRYVGQTFYVRADLPALLNDLGQSATAAGGFQSALQGADAYVPGLAALGQGNWVSVPAEALRTVLNGLQTEIPGAAGAANSSNSGQLWSQIEKAFTANTEFAQVGTQRGRTHYMVRLAVRPFVQDLETSLPASLGSLPGASSLGKQINSAIGKIPAHQKVVADVWVSGNKVQEIDIDLNQFDHKFSFAVPLRIVIGPGAPVVVPSGATPLNLSKVGGLLGGMLSQHSAS